MVIVFESNIGIGFRFDWFIDIWDKKRFKIILKICINKRVYMIL